MRQINRLFFVSLFTFILGCSLSLAVYSNYISLQCEEEKTLRSLTKRLKNNSNTTKSYEYVVLILSKYDNTEQRNAIRESWLKLMKKKYIYYETHKEKWTHYFFVSTSNLSQHSLMDVNSENEKFGDLVAFPHMKELYSLLTHKLMEAFKWIHRNNPNLLYILKCDDDSFVRIDLIIKELHIIRRKNLLAELKEGHQQALDRDRFKLNHMPTSGLYWGYFKGNAHVQKKGKWSEKDFFLCDRYLPYAQGGGYVLSYDIVDFIVKNANYLKFYKSEDVSVGVWTAPLVNVNRLHDKRFDTEWTSRGCDDIMLIRHQKTPSEMREMYKTLVSSSNIRLCSKPSFLRHPYEYNWSVAPSQCCSAV